jgi:hypothetical protein
MESVKSPTPFRATDMVPAVMLKPTTVTVEPKFDWDDIPEEPARLSDVVKPRPVRVTGLVTVPSVPEAHVTIGGALVAPKPVTVKDPVPVQADTVIAKLILLLPVPAIERLVAVNDDAPLAENITAGTS